jgi:hypothetical protein
MATLLQLMNRPSQVIQDALNSVQGLRQTHAADAQLALASTAVKRFQARRFEATYRDLLDTPRYQPAARFFLDELYSDKDFSQRDQQFARIANTLTQLFPQSVVDTAQALAEAHALTEDLDARMALAWATMSPPPNANLHNSSAEIYIACWRQAAQPNERQKQLTAILGLGQRLDQLTRKPGLRTLLKMMRAPANAAGLGSLQQFLEAGFDAFAAMRGAGDFLRLIGSREQAGLTHCFLTKSGSALGSWIACWLEVFSQSPPSRSGKLACGTLPVPCKIY